MKLVLSLLTIVLALSILGQPARAQISFGGSCPSSGPWTQRALLQTEEIANSLDQMLKDSKECAGLAQVSANIRSRAQNLVPVSGNSSSENILEGFPSNESALLSMYQGSSGSLKENLTRALLQDKLTSATHIANQGLNVATHNTSIAMEQAAGILDQLTSTLPAYDKCLVGHVDQAGALFGNLIDLSATFISSGGGFNRNTGGIISKVVGMVRDRKFAAAFRHVKQAQFWNSMSCLLETTAETYCSVEDALHLLDRDEEHPKFSVENTGFQKVNPLSGYYALTLHVPNIAQFIQQVQFGIEPQWTTDADFKINAASNTFNFQTSDWRILGKFHDDMRVYQSQQDLPSKRNTLLSILEKLVENLTAGNFYMDPSQHNAINFYTMSVQAAYIPWYLIGRDSIPPDAVTTQFGGVPLEWSAFMKGAGKFEKVAEFQNPDALAVTIEKKLYEINKIAYQKANDFYQQRIIVNQGNLLAQSVVDPRFTVHQSFKFLYQYLTQLDRMFSTPDPNYRGDNEERYLILHLRDTLRRIGVVLQAYGDLDTKNGNFHPRTDADSEYSQAQLALVNKTIYSQFDVLYQRDSFITNAITQFVYADYIFRINHGLGFGAYERDLITSLNHDLISFIQDVHEIDPTNKRVQLARANTTNLENIAAVEQIFSDPMKMAIDELNMIVAGKNTSDWALSRRSGKRLWQDTFANGLAQRDNPAMTGLSSLFGIPGRLWSQYTTHVDAYNFPMTTAPSTRPSRDTTYHDVAIFRDQLCIQSLMFDKHREDFAGLCKDVVLDSHKRSPEIVLSASYENILRAPHTLDPVDGLDHYQENNVCAFRNFRRRNLVYWLTQHIQVASRMPLEDLPPSVNPVDSIPLGGASSGPSGTVTSTTKSMTPNQPISQDPGPKTRFRVK